MFEFKDATMIYDMDKDEMVYAMKEFVPEYKSMHSKFEAIDKELEGETVDAPAAPDTHQLSAE